MTDNLKNILSIIDHTNLKPDTTEKDILKLCSEALDHNFYSVCINPIHVPLAKNILQHSNIKITTVAGFPLGANRTDIKLTEAVKAVSDGADEIDMVANIGWLKDSQFAKAEKEISDIRKNLPYNIILKVIVEGSLLTDIELTEAAKTVLNGGAQFVKTSTGFFGGATVEMVGKIRDAIGNDIEIKASGGIRTLADCCALVESGAARIGCSASVEIAKEIAAQEDK